jgi:hypothetical protein
VIFCLDLWLSKESTYMNTENQVKANQARRWQRVALLTYTLASPLVNALAERFRRREQSVPKTIQTTQPDVRQRLNELTLESRQWVAEQIQQLNEQARQLRLQSRQLGKAVRREAKQRRKLVDQVRKSGIDWSQDLLKRSGQLSGDFVERGGKLTQDLLERSGQTAHDLAERSGEFTQELTKRSGKIAQELTERGEHLLKPARKRDRNFWMIVGVVAGLVAAGIVTYRLVRLRNAEQESEQDEQIELPQNEAWDGTQRRPAGEIRHLDQEGVTVATIPTMIEVEITERPADAAFVGIVSTKQYYPIDTPLEPEDLVYFASEEEAQARGFTFAE